MMFVFSSFTSSGILFQTGSDTSVSAVLEESKPKVTVSVSFNDSTMAFVLKAGDARVTETFEEAFVCDLQILDINSSDDYKEIAVVGIGNSDYCQAYFYRFTGGKLVRFAYITGASNIKAEGNGILKTDNWMGFWMLTEDYAYDSKAMTLVKKPKDTYPVSDAEAKVTVNFPLRKTRDDNSESAGMLKPGTKIKVIKADISPTCKNADGSDDSWLCHWYYIKASDGSEGWCRLKTFWQSVEGLPWAG